MRPESLLKLLAFVLPLGLDSFAVAAAITAVWATTAAARLPASGDLTRTASMPHRPPHPHQHLLDHLLKLLGILDGRFVLNGKKGVVFSAFISVEHRCSTIFLGPRRQALTNRGLASVTIVLR
jgi:hypothetical protein